MLLLSDAIMQIYSSFSLSKISSHFFCTQFRDAIFSKNWSDTSYEPVWKLGPFKRLIMFYLFYLKASNLTCSIWHLYSYFICIFLQQIEKSWQEYDWLYLSCRKRVSRLFVKVVDLYFFIQVDELATQFSKGLETREGKMVHPQGKHLKGGDFFNITDTRE